MTQEDLIRSSMQRADYEEMLEGARDFVLIHDFKYYGNPVTLDGDRFLLTVPSEQAMLVLKELYDREMASGWSAPWNEELVVNYEDGHMPLRALKYWATKGLTNSTYAKPWATYGFRPCLIPLTRDGDYDTQFAKNMPSGARVTGGVLMQGKTPCAMSRKLSSAPVTVKEGDTAVWYAADGFLVGGELYGLGSIKTLKRARMLPPAIDI